MEKVGGGETGGGRLTDKGRKRKRGDIDREGERGATVREKKEGWGRLTEGEG